MSERTPADIVSLLRIYVQKPKLWAGEQWADAVLNEAADLIERQQQLLEQALDEARTWEGEAVSWKTWCEQARAEIERRDAVATSRWGDQADAFTPEIVACHPAHTGRDHEVFDAALHLINARHGKYELVALINWLLLAAGANLRQRVLAVTKRDG